MSTHVIVGAGGIGCWLVPLLKKMIKKEDRIIVMDGDRIEQRNFDRQLHDPAHLGWNKAEALAYQYDLGDFYPRYLTRATRPPLPVIGWVWCCVDNHPARKECLEWLDDTGANGVFGGNEYESGHAYLYSNQCKGTVQDPRVRYPEILTETSGDPNHPNCTGAAQEVAPQLALYNYLVAGQMVHLYQFWLNHGPFIEDAFWPIEHGVTFTQFNTIRIKQLDEYVCSIPQSRGEIQNSEVSSD